MDTLPDGEHQALAAWADLAMISPLAESGSQGPTEPRSGAGMIRNDSVDLEQSGRESPTEQTSGQARRLARPEWRIWVIAAAPKTPIAPSSMTQLMRKPPNSRPMIAST